MKKNNPGYVLYVYLGEIQNSNTYSYNWAIKHIPTIEKLLIISHSEFSHLENKKSIGWFSTGEWIKIENSGFRNDGMYNVLTYGPCYV